MVENQQPQSTPPNLSLIYTGCERLNPKNFREEVRAQLDVEVFVNQAHLILDADDKLELKQLVSYMLERVISGYDESKYEDAARQIFLPGFPDRLASTIQGSLEEPPQTMRYDPSWLVATASLSQVDHRHLIVARFKRPVKLSDNADQVRLFMLILAPLEDKATKSALETARTFATMLMDSHFRLRLIDAGGQLEFKSLMMVKAQLLSEADNAFKKSPYKYVLDVAPHLGINFDTFKKSPQQQVNERRSFNIFGKNPRTSKLFELISVTDRATLPAEDGQIEAMERRKQAKEEGNESQFGRGLWEDIRRRSRFYLSDFSDGFFGPPKTVQKSISASWFLYFGILLPTIAFSALNTTQTHGQLGDLRMALLGQAIGGLIFALFAGQPLVIVMTTAPLCLYTKVIHQMCLDYDFNFRAMYAAVGLWNAFFLAIYSLFGFSRLMKWCTRSTEEVFALFIVVAFITDASKDLIKNFHRYYFSPACGGSQLNRTESITAGFVEESPCSKETSLLFIILMLGTLWLALTLYRFRRTPYFTAGLRDLLADYALPLAVVLMSFLGSSFFSDIYVDKFPTMKELILLPPPLVNLTPSGIIASMCLGFTLSVLFFMDQNISAAMVDAPQNNLKKGPAYHYDLLVVALLNAFLTFFGFPMMHGVLPHSPLHVRCLADIKEHVESGHKQEIISNVRETRVTGVLSHLLLLASLYLIPYPIAYIPTAVLNGLFLYMAITSLDGLDIFDRILLLFTEQSKYPPNKIVRNCPQKKIHLFTLIQLAQLLVLCLFGFSPINIMEMFFPVIILLMIPLRQRVITNYIDDQYLGVLDGKHQ